MMLILLSYRRKFTTGPRSLKASPCLEIFRLVSYVMPDPFTEANYCQFEESYYTINIRDRVCIDASFRAHSLFLCPINCKALR